MDKKRILLFPEMRVTKKIFIQATATTLAALLFVEKQTALTFIFRREKADSIRTNKVTIGKPPYWRILLTKPLRLWI